MRLYIRYRDGDAALHVFAHECMLEMGELIYIGAIFHLLLRLEYLLIC